MYIAQNQHEILFLFFHRKDKNKELPLLSLEYSELC